MKRIYIIAAFAALLVGAVSCEKFFDREPEDEFDVAQFFKSETDLQYYCNGLVDAALPGASSMALGDDFYCDLAASKESQQFFWPGRYNPSISTGWSASNFSLLRQVAYMLDNMGNAKENVSEEKYNHYEGVARFFRAYITFNRVKKFGDFYWIDHVVSQSDSTILYGPRQDREFVMHNVVEDLKFAAANCLTAGAGIKTDACVHVNKYVALALASRVCLYEGTYRRYHSKNPSTGKPWNGEYESAEELLQLAFDFSKELVDTKAFSLTSDYGALFTSATLNPKEVIWGCSYSADLAAGHNVTYSFSASTQPHPSPTKDYVMMFLGSDGKPLPSGEISMSKEFYNRDKRLTASVLGPNGTKKVGGKDVSFTPDFTWTPTGYMWIKWIQREEGPMTLSSNGSFNSIPVFRYAEVLLNYAEAAAELGQMSKALWEDTIGALRNSHGGISNSGYPGTADYVADSWLRQYYTDVKHPVSLTDVILEIRRERAVELTLEADSRYQDLMRWNMGDLIVRRYNKQGWRGIYVSKEEAASGFTFNGKEYTVSTSKSTNETNYKISSAGSDMNWTFSNGSYGYLIYNYALQWDDKMYLYPIPVTAINVNPELRQNDGWQWL